MIIEKKELTPVGSMTVFSHKGAVKHCIYTATTAVASALYSSVSPSRHCSRIMRPAGRNIVFLLHPFEKRFKKQF